MLRITVQFRQDFGKVIHYYRSLKWVLNIIRVITVVTSRKVEIRTYVFRDSIYFIEYKLVIYYVYNMAHKYHFTKNKIYNNVIFKKKTVTDNLLNLLTITC